MPGLQAWRLSKARYAHDAFTGDGPKLYGGRWNPVGIPVVYSSLSLSLAVLEVFVHMTIRPGLDDYVSVEVDLGIRLDEAERVSITNLPQHWKQINSPALREIGRNWAETKRSLVLLVPSVIVSGEWNAVLNPMHPQAQAMNIHPPEPFFFDERMFTERR